MYFTGLPFINVTMNGVAAMVAPASGKEFAHLSVFAPLHREDGGDYYAFSQKSHPQEDDQSDFAKLYRLLRGVVVDGNIRGPFGEDHPAVYYRFEYPPSAAELTIRKLLEVLVAAGITVVVTRISFSRENHTLLRMKLSEYEAHTASLKEQARMMVGPWMDEKTEFILPERVDVEAQDRELEEWRQQQRDLPSLSFGQRFLEGVATLVIGVPLNLLARWDNWRYRKRK